jgi:hypothetical protein
MELPAQNVCLWPTSLSPFTFFLTKNKIVLVLLSFFDFLFWLIYSIPNHFLSTFYFLDLLINWWIYPILYIKYWMNIKREGVLSRWDRFL